jgi:hypothetical protein
MNRKILYSLFAVSFAIFSCKKNKEVPAGNVNIHVNVKHHAAAIAFSKVYIKYNTLDFPGKDSSLYDTYVTTDANGYVEINNIGNGEKKYILYGKGIDPNFDSTHTTPVWGFQPVLVTTKPGEDKEKYVTIPVSE